MIPAYNDGKFSLFEITQGNKLYPQEVLKDTGISIWFNELSVSDRTKAELKQNEIEVTMKIRIPQYKKINSNCVVKIDNEYHRVFNVFHFKNKDGFPETDITLERYNNL